MNENDVGFPSLLVELGDIKTLTFGTKQCPQDANY